MTGRPERARRWWWTVGSVLALVGAACGAGGDEKASSDGQVVKLVYLGAMTGDYANLGVSGRDAVQLAIDEANGRGDLAVRLELEVFDTQLDPAQAQLLATKAVTDRGIIGSVGPLSSGETKAASPTLEEGGLPFVTVASNPDLARHGWKTFHRLMANDDIQGNEVARYIDKGLKAKTVSIVHDNTEYGKALAVVAESALRERGVATQVDVIDPKALDYSAAVNIVKARQPAVVFYGGYYPEAGRLVKQLRDAGVTAPFVAGDASKDPGIAAGAGKAAEGALATCACTDPQHQPEPAAQAFAKAYQARFGRPPQLYSAEFYDGTQLMIDAIRRGARTREAVLANLNSTQLEGVTKKFSFQPDGEVGAGLVYVYEFRAGAFVSLGTTTALAP
ncbi:MAG TPA: branched-chain amino acid ABC transporter substrate-binding protein [Acidimicrobiia bacterium]|nr:branched-chain amino acid ABC transporter substrate-binding protein [Acidimicrobiia bacterium]